MYFVFYVTEARSASGCRSSEIGLVILFLLILAAWAFAHSSASSRTPCSERTFPLRAHRDGGRGWPWVKTVFATR